MASPKEEPHDEDESQESLVEPFRRVTIDGTRESETESEAGSETQSELTESDRAIRTALQNACREVDVNEPEFITEDHAVFEPAQRFRTKWNIGPEQWNNFSQLLRGFSHFPIILLQNPAPSHWKPFEEMRQCSTISWLSQELENIGLSLNLVPVVDVCSFFSDQDLEEMGVLRRWEAVESSYKLLEEIFDKLRPTLKVVVCCQCVTRGRFKDNKTIWRAAKSPLAKQLCSSVKNAREGLALPIYLNGSTIPIDWGRYTLWGVQAFHPRYANFDPRSADGILLRQILKRVFQPCVDWYRQFLISSMLQLIKDFEEKAPDHLRATREMFESDLLGPDEVETMKTLARSYFANWQSLFEKLCDSYGNPEDEVICRLVTRFDEVAKKTKEKVNGPMTNTSGFNVNYLRGKHT
ncbi:hypothetical protein K456DRAFT_38007 [Colletotrichum gloeosporioides 23]|nr:hypothetical protein K456DRAFT_38007 [Colletotrichum gloeosporioides 23]